MESSSTEASTEASTEEIEHNLSLETATLNFALLRSLPAGTKIYVNTTTGQMSLEDRWFSGARRYAEGSSRSDLVQPLRETFLRMRDTSATQQELLSTFNYTRERLLALYPEFEQHFVDLELELFPHPPTPPTPPPSPVPTVVAQPPPPLPARRGLAVRRRGSEVIIQIPDDFEPERTPNDLIPDDKEESTTGCFPSESGLSCWQRTVNFFRGIGNKERSE